MEEVKPIKCVIVGDGAVGKTCMLISYCLNKFPEDYVPTVFDNYSVELDIQNVTQKLELWDTAGQEEYEQLRPLSYPNTDIFLICYSTVDRTSFANIEKWCEELRSFWSENGTQPVPILLVGTKTDLISNPAMLRRLLEKKERVITLKESELVAKKINAAGTVQCSAKTQENLKSVFDMAVNCVLENRFNKKNGCWVL